jgi:hypothetical protein
VSYIGSGGFPCSRTLLCMQLFANTLKEQLVDCTREYIERGGLCSLLKLRQMGTRGVHVKGVVPWLVRWARRGSFVPLAQQAGHSAVPGHLSLSVCLWTAPL